MENDKQIAELYCYMMNLPISKINKYVCFIVIILINVSIFTLKKEDLKIKLDILVSDIVKIKIETT